MRYTLLLLLLIFSGGAHSALITMEFRATVTSSDLASVTLGEVIQGFYTADTAFIDQNPGPNVGAYDIVGGSVTVGAFSYSLMPSPGGVHSFLGPVASSNIVNDDPAQGDAFNFNVFMGGADVEGFTPHNLAFQTFDNIVGDAEFVNSDDQFLGTIPLGIFDNKNISLLFSGEVVDDQIITSAHVGGVLTFVGPVSVGVRLPQTLWLLMTALFGLLLIASRNQFSNDSTYSPT